MTSVTFLCLLLVGLHVKLTETALAACQSASYRDEHGLTHYNNNRDPN